MYIVNNSGLIITIITLIHTENIVAIFIRKWMRENTSLRCGFIDNFSFYKQYVVWLLCRIQDWENIVLKSLSYLIGNKTTLRVQNDDPAHLVMSLKTQIDYVIQRVMTPAKDELTNNLQRVNSRGTLNDILLCCPCEKTHRKDAIWWTLTILFLF